MKVKSSDQKGFAAGLKHRIEISCIVTLLFFVCSTNVSFAPTASVETDIRRDATVEAIEKAVPSVVSIVTATVKEYGDFYDPILRKFYGQVWRREELFSIGSGVIIDEDGYILTNLHVVRRATRAQVKLWDGKIYDADPVVATTQKDLAVLKLRTKPGEKIKLKAIKLGKDDDLLLGETVIALGNPYGLGGSVTRGILSSKNRRSVSGNEPLDSLDYLQTDADINPGNSGGPLINLRGELIGINVADYREEQGAGVGFAIPVKQVAASLSDFFSPEVTGSAWFGARVRTDTLPLIITEIQPGSPADKAGLRPGWQILQVDGQPPASLMDFNSLITAGKGRNVALKVQQGAETSVVNVKVVPLGDLIRDKLGLVLQKLTPEIAASFGIGPGEGLLVENVEKGGPAERVQVQRGFLLRAVDGEPAGNVLAVASTIWTKKPGETVKLTVLAAQQGPGSAEFRQGTVNVQVR